MNLDQYYQRLERVDPTCWTGSVTEMIGLIVESNGPAAAIGDFCEIETQPGKSIRT